MSEGGEPGPKLISSPKKKRAKKSAMSSSEKNTIINIYKLAKEMWPMDIFPYKRDIAIKKAETAGVHISTVYSIIKQYMIDHRISSPPPHTKRLKKIDQVSDFELCGIRRKVHQYFFRNEVPTLAKVLKDVNDDDDLPNLKKTTFRDLLTTKLKIKYLKRLRNSSLIEKEEIVMWRRTYLSKIKQLREEGRKLYYTDKTWINEGHTKSKIWQDLSITSSREAHRAGLSTGLKGPSGKGKRLIIVHIGNEDGFLEGGEFIFESKKGEGDYHKEMNAECYEAWFKKIIEKLEPRSIVIMDNAPYHSRRLEQVPNMQWEKDDIKNWLSEKGVSFQDTMIKRELIELIKPIKENYMAYAIDTIAKEKNIEVLRLPPYHCELNPIQMIWGQVKGHVAAKNRTFKMKELKILLKESMELITPAAWHNCISHVIKEEIRMSDLDDITDQFVNQVTEEMSTSLSSSDSST